MKRLWLHMRSLWPRWTLVPVAPMLIYGFIMIGIGDLRWDHAAMMIILPFLAYFNAATKRLFVGGYGIALTSLLYDMMRYFRNLGVSPERVHDCDLRAMELKLFGLTVAGERITVQDWFLTHNATIADLYFALPYGTYIFACLGCAVVLWRRDYVAVQRFAWGFFVMNVAGFITYHLYPSAPPWYYHSHGCTIDMTANPEPGPRLAHVDEVLGFGYFHGLYARSSDIFGAVPSLHVAYPLLIVIHGWRLFHWPGRIFSLVFFASMCVAAVYLDHHWVIDVVIGLFYCGFASLLVHLVSNALRGAPQNHEVSPDGAKVSS